jgi:transcriptional regulator with XRE-family HTH domain
LESIRYILSKNLRELRKERGLTQVDIAALAGFQEASYNRWETGKSWPEVDTISALAKALNVPESRLFLDTSIISPKIAIKVLSSLVESLD